MPSLRVHELRIDRAAAPSGKLRVHALGIDRDATEDPPGKFRVHALGVSKAPGAPGADGVWISLDGATWTLCDVYVPNAAGTAWDELDMGGSSGSGGTTEPWPTFSQVGPDDDPSTYPQVGDITTTSNGQVIEKVRCTGMIRIQHSNVTVRDVYMNNGPTGDGQYWIRTEFGGNVGNILIERVEIDAPALANGVRTIAMNFPGVNSGGVTIRDSYIHGVGSGPRFYNNCHIQDSIVQANFYAGSSSHRSGIGNNGGANCSASRCRIECRGNLSSAAIALYGDNAECINHTFEDNLLIAADGFIAYGGSTSGKPFPVGNNIVYRRNKFQFMEPYSGPLYGAITDFTPGVNGCVSENNTWASSATLDDGTVVTSGQPI